MDFCTADNSTPRERQRSIFIGSLYHEMEKIAVDVDARNSRLTREASKLILEDGLSDDIAVDLLILDGFDGRLARQCVKSISCKTVTTVIPARCRFDYCFEDHKGRIFTGRELGNLVEANTKEEALTLAKEVLASFDPPVRLLDVSEAL